MELVEKINEYKAKNGSYPASIISIYEALEDNRGVKIQDWNYSDNGSYFSLMIHNENWGWFSLRYRPKKKIFELSDSD